MRAREQVRQQKHRRDRKREFRDIRLSHSTNKLALSNQYKLSPSPLKQSQKQSQLQKSQLSRISRFQNKAQVNYQQSPQNMRSHSHNNLVCVGCFNKKQVDSKRRRKALEQIKTQEQNNMRQSFLINEKCKMQLYQSQVKQQVQSVNDVNRRLIERHEMQKKLKQQQIRQQYQQMKQKQYQYQQLKYDKQRTIAENQSLHRANLQQQIRTHSLIEHKMNKQQINLSIVETMLQNPINNDQNIVRTMHNNYRQQLLRQIHQKQQKKRAQLGQRTRNLSIKNESQFQLITFAQKRKQQARKAALSIKQASLRQMNKKCLNQKQNKQISQKQRQLQKQQRKKMSKKEQEQHKRQQQVRRQKIDKYLSDLKHQMQQNKQKRIQQLKWINDRKLTQPLINKTIIPQDNCAGCQKKYPRRMLSQFVQ